MAAVAGEGFEGGDDENIFADIAANFGRELLLGPTDFKPIYMIGTWKHPTDNDSLRVSVAILLPSGIGENSDDLTVNVVDDGHYLELCVLWPSAMNDRFMLHKKWLTGFNVPKV